MSAITAEGIVDHVIGKLDMIEHGEYADHALWFTPPGRTEQMCLYEFWMFEQTGVYRPIKEARTYAREHGIGESVAQSSVLMSICTLSTFYFYYFVIAITVAS